MNTLLVVEGCENAFKYFNKRLREEYQHREEIFLEWEKDARTSISKILNNFLSDISNKEEVIKNISATIKSTIGNKKDLYHQKKLDAFYRTLNGTLSDAIENNISHENKHDEFLNSLDIENLDENIKAEINSKTLFELIINDDKTLAGILTLHELLHAGVN